MVKEKNREGFSLTELMIAIAITSIVMLGVLAILGYALNSMSMTQAEVNLQDQSKDALKHISSYVMESESATWKASDGDIPAHLLVEKSEKELDGSVKTDSLVQYAYWVVDKKMYFTEVGDGAGKIKESDIGTLTDADLKKCLLADDIATFECEQRENKATKRKLLHIKMRLADDKADFETERDVYWRNQE